MIARASASVRKLVRVREVVLSGLFDSIGLYLKVNESQAALADRWLACIGMNDRAERPFSQLSYGEKRLVLIARAMIKSPELLILDEPCQGLDRSNREMVLALMEEISRRPSTTMIYVTHQEKEMIPCIQHVLRLERGLSSCSGFTENFASRKRQLLLPQPSNEKARLSEK